MSDSEKSRETSALTATVNQEAKNYAIISYITIFGLIIALILNSEKQYEFTRFHIRQSLGLSASLFALGLFNIIPLLGQLVFLLGSLAGLVLWVFGLLNAVNGRSQTLPVVGDFYQSLLRNL